MLDIAATFEEFNDEFLAHKRLTPDDDPVMQMTTRNDLRAFLILDRLIPGMGDILGSAEHDEVFLSVDMNALAETATEADIRTLTRLGVRYDSEHDCLMMFV